MWRTSAGGHGRSGTGPARPRARTGSGEFCTGQWQGSSSSTTASDAAGCGQIGPAAANRAVARKRNRGKDERLPVPPKRRLKAKPAPAKKKKRKKNRFCDFARSAMYLVVVSMGTDASAESWQRSPCRRNGPRRRRVTREATGYGSKLQYVSFRGAARSEVRRDATDDGGS